MPTTRPCGDPRLSDYARATDVALRKARGTEHGLYIAESTLVLERALGAGHTPRSVLALPSWVDAARQLVGDDVPIFTGPGEVLAGLTGYVLHRGVIAAMNRPALPDPAALLGDARRVVVLENVVDPTNVGAIFRSVGAIGADAVLVTPRCSDPFYRRAIRVSMGTVLQVPWTRVGDWPPRASCSRIRIPHRRPRPHSGCCCRLREFVAAAPRTARDGARHRGRRAHARGDRRRGHRDPHPDGARHRLAQRGGGQRRRAAL